MLPFIEPGVSPVDNAIASRELLSIPDQLERMAAVLRRPGALPVTAASTVGDMLQKLPVELREPLLAVLRVRDARPEGHGLDALPAQDMVSFCSGVQHALVAIRLGGVSGYLHGEARRA